MRAGIEVAAPGEYSTCSRQHGRRQSLSSVCQEMVGCSRGNHNTLLQVKHQAGNPNRRAFARLKRAILEDYSYRDLREVNWKRRFVDFAPKIRSASSPSEFAKAAADLLSAARDIHLWLRMAEQTIPTYRRSYRGNVALSALPRLIPGWRQLSGEVACGQFEDGIWYLCLRGWPAACPKALSPAHQILRRAQAAGKGLVIDVRANGGGAEPLAARFAARFVSRRVCYAKHLTRRAGRFTPVQERWLEPGRASQRYHGRVAVLVGRGTVSTCESFALMMRQVPGCRLIGQPTAGASGNPMPVDLGNGVVLFVPSWVDLAPDGTSLEGHGVIPDVQVEATPEKLSKADPVLLTALRFLRE